MPQAEAPLPWSQALAGGVGRDIDPSSAYVSHLGRLLDLPGLRDAGLKIVV